MTVPLTHGMSYPYTIKFHAQTKKVKSSLVANVEPKGASSGYALPDSSSSLSIVSPFTDYFLSFLSYLHHRSCQISDFPTI
jgi:hypothetical protein